LVRLLMRSPMNSAELIDHIQRELKEDGYPAAASSALKHDLDALKSEYGCRIIYQRTEGVYLLEDLGHLALLDLSDSATEALAYLDSTYQSGTGHATYDQTRDLIDRVTMMVPGASQERLRRRRSVTRPDGRPIGRLDATVLAALKRAIKDRREVQFRYWSLSDAEQPRRHRVAPYRLFFRPEGHGYLDATLLEVTPPGQDPLNAAIDYRLDRIVSGSVQVLSQELPAQRVQPFVYTIRYRLLPVVVQSRDMPTFFPESEVTFLPDGSAQVTARVTNLWQARQILLRYGEHCIVSDPPELEALFKNTARGLMRLYSKE
jgi:predicted DNA-binding transcriptional regulator YafY